MSNHQSRINGTSDRTVDTAATGESDGRWRRMRRRLKMPVQLLGIVIGQILGQLTRWALQHWMGR